MAFAKYLSSLLKRYPRAFTGAGCLVLGIFIGGALVPLVWPEASVSKARPLRESSIPTSRVDYTFIDPLIGIRGLNESAKYTEMQRKISSYIADERAHGLIVASVDFRDIGEQGGFVINPDELYTPASLNKVPVMMAYFKLAEKTPDILSRELFYSGATNTASIQEIKPAIQITPGKRYTIGKLIEYMIRYSDNNATDLLTGYLRDTNNLPTYIAVFGDLGVNPNVLSAYTDNMKVRDYSMFLRALYNATYLTRDYSEEALKLLSETDFSHGIESGVPNNTLIAEKFGEVYMTNSAGDILGKELHNCGIVYFPGHPYLVCIMTKASGDDIETLEKEIATISSLIYKGMQTLYP